MKQSQLTAYELDRAKDPERSLVNRESSRWRTIDREAMLLSWASSLLAEDRERLLRPVTL